jgi:hypothetical protein
VCGSEVDLVMKTTTKDMEKVVEGCDKMKDDVTDLSQNCRRIRKFEKNEMPSEDSN